MEAASTRLVRRNVSSAAQPADDPYDPMGMAARVEAATSREQAVAELNEFVSEVSRQLGSGAKVPSALARASFASGVLFAVLALADTMADGASAVVVTPALVSLVAGVAAGGACMQIGRVANKRRLALREAAERLRRELGRRLPSKAPQGSASRFGGG
jgi:hypothetical protein